jgi:sensor histidine kinase YesM
MRGIGDMQQAIWEISKVGIIMFLSFAMVIITAFFSAVVGKLFRKFSGLITFIVFIATNYVSTKSIAEIMELITEGMSNPYIQKEMMVGGTVVFSQILPNSIFMSIIILIIITSILLFLATTTIYDKKVEL